MVGLVFLRLVVHSKINENLLILLSMQRQQRQQQQLEQLFVRGACRGVCGGVHGVSCRGRESSLNLGMMNRTE
jgi:hypothetical protein